MRVITSEYEISGKLITFARSKLFPPEHNLPPEKNSMERAAFWHEVKVVCILTIPSLPRSSPKNACVGG